MTIELTELGYLLVSLTAVMLVHFLADFIFQSDEMANNKSKSIRWLSYHTLVYTFCMLLFGYKFALLAGLSHFMVDYITSKCTSYLWLKGDKHNFFVVIGFDQFLHTVILFSLFLLL